jgi:hypothetical protein
MLGESAFAVSLSFKPGQRNGCRHGDGEACGGGQQGDPDTASKGCRIYL